jgi:hypothetical protein
VSAALVEVVGRIYAPRADAQSSLDRSREAADEAFGGHLGAQIYALRLTSDDRVELDAMGVRDAVPR